jgi:hypothetical protein
MGVVKEMFWLNQASTGSAMEIATTGQASSQNEQPMQFTGSFK